VIDTNPHRVKNDFSDVSKVEKYEISEEDYSKRDGIWDLSDVG